MSPLPTGVVTMAGLWLALSVSAQAQAPSFRWAARGGSSVSQDYGRGVGLDAAGNCYVTGFFQSTSSFSGTNLTSRGYDDILLAKYDINGNLVWARQAGGSDFDEGYALAVDAAGNCYVTGYFQGTATFGNTNLTSDSRSFDSFVAKYDHDGTLLWVRPAGGSGSDFGYGIAVDGSGNVIVTGHFTGTANFSGTNLVSAGGTDIFLAKYDSSGTLLWARTAGGTGDDRGNAVVVDAGGNCYVTGYFAGTASFGGSSLVSTGFADVFAAKYDPAGSLVWAQRGGGSFSDSGLGIGVDSGGNTYITGQFIGTFGIGTTNLAGDGLTDMFLAKLDPAGNLVWATHAGGGEFDGGYALAVDAAGNSFVAGYFEDESLGGDVLVAKYDPSGRRLWAKVAVEGQDALCYAIALDTAGDIYVTGSFVRSFRFDAVSLTSVGTEDMFVAKLEPTTTLTIGFTGGQAVLTWPAAGGLSLQTSGSVTNATGWSSVLTPPVIVGGMNVVTNSLSEGNRFFRLVKP